MNRNVRISRVELDELKAALASALADKHNLQVMFRKAAVQQTTVHLREVSALSSELAAMSEALKTCLELVETAQRGWWTPADDKRLAEIREIVSGAQHRERGG